MIDTNVNLSRWPFRRVRGDEPATLVAHLKRRGVEQAWAGSFDGLLHEDIAAVNERLAEDCRRHGKGFLVPFGSVNPALPDWEEDVRRCHEEHGMPGLRLHPNYHGYTLDDPRFERLLRMAAERKLLVQMAYKMEDERTQHPLLRVKPVDVEPLPKLLAKIRGLRFMIVNGLRSVYGDPMTTLAPVESVYFEIAMLEGAGILSRLSERISLDRVFFGSYSPLFTFESAQLKVREGGLGPVQEKRLLKENARSLLGGR